MEPAVIDAAVRLTVDAEQPAAGFVIIKVGAAFKVKVPLADTDEQVERVLVIITL